MIIIFTHQYYYLIIVRPLCCVLSICYIIIIIIIFLFIEGKIYTTQDKTRRPWWSSWTVKLNKNLIIFLRETKRPFLKKNRNKRSGSKHQHTNIINKYRSLKMEQDSKTNLLCKMGCGFFGNQSFEGMCSKCYKDNLKRQQQPSPTAGRTTSPATATAGMFVLLLLFTFSLLLFLLSFLSVYNRLKLL